MSSEHEQFIKTPKQLIVVVVLSFLVPIVVIIALANYMNKSLRTGAGSEGSKTSVEARIKPVAGFELKGAAGAAALKDGETVYNAQCGACHNVGAAGAPKLGDAGAWAARIKTGYDALLSSALKGKGAMAAQGGGDYEDLEIARAVVYMANKGGGKFDEPKAPAAKAEEGK
jgi:cytochrome c5